MAIALNICKQMERALLCRDAIRTAPNEATAQAIRGNFGSMLLSSGHAAEALRLLADAARPPHDEAVPLASLVRLCMPCMLTVY